MKYTKIGSILVPDGAYLPKLSDTLQYRAGWAAACGKCRFIDSIRPKDAMWLVFGVDSDPRDAAEPVGKVDLLRVHASRSLIGREFILLYPR